LKRARTLEAGKEAGNAAFKAGKLTEALEIYTKTLAIDPENEGTNSKLFSNRATVLTKLGKQEEALNDYDKALELDPTFSKVYYKRAAAHMKLERFEEAVRDYKSALERDQGSREIRSQLHEAELALKKSLRKDYYKVLGVSKDCADADIKKAYRKLALQYHPDKNPGDQQAEVKFKEIGEAYAILSDPQKKQRYDSGVDLDGMAGGFPGDVNVDVNDIFAQFFGGAGGMNAADFSMGGGGFPGGRRGQHSFHHGRPQGFQQGTQFHFG
jgi:DnaJ family protein C protein 7